jgi:hypothetical protein
MAAATGRPITSLHILGNFSGQRTRGLYARGDKTGILRNMLQSADELTIYQEEA